MSRKDFEDADRVRQRGASPERRGEAEEVTAEMRPPALEDLERDRSRELEREDVADAAPEE